MPELGSAMHASGVGPETYLLEWLTSMFAVAMPEAVTFHMMDFVLANADVHTMGVIHVCTGGGEGVLILRLFFACISIIDRKHASFELAPEHVCRILARLSHIIQLVLVLCSHYWKS